jgi:hypothetical protein
LGIVDFYFKRGENGKEFRFSIMIQLTFTDEGEIEKLHYEDFITSSTRYRGEEMSLYLKIEISSKEIHKTS